jgi:hypothetical protein
MFPGTHVRIGDEEFVIPPISLGQLRGGLLAKLQQHDALIAEGKVFETMEIRGDVILAALRRNYPDFPEEKLFSHLDMGNTGPIWLAILGASGFNPGEVVAAGPTNGTGTLSPSTEVSPLPTAGLSAR